MKKQTLSDKVVDLNSEGKQVIFCNYIHLSDVKECFERIFDRINESMKNDLLFNVFPESTIVAFNDCFKDIIKYETGFEDLE